MLSFCLRPRNIWETRHTHFISASEGSVTAFQEKHVPNDEMTKKWWQKGHQVVRKFVSKRFLPSPTNASPRFHQWSSSLHQNGGEIMLTVLQQRDNTGSLCLKMLHCSLSILGLLRKLFTDVSITRSVESHYKDNYYAHNFVITLSRGRQRPSLSRPGSSEAARCTHGRLREIDAM